MLSELQEVRHQNYKKKNGLKWISASRVLRVSHKKYIVCYIDVSAMLM